MLTAIARGIGSTRAGQAFSDYVKYGKRLAPHQAAIIDRLPAARNVMALGGSYLDASQILYTGEKFAGGWGLNRDYEIVNLHEVRRHSLELWRSNPIAVSIFGRLETKIINDGLRLEALPEARFLGFNDNSPELQEWTDDAEGYMGLYADDAKLVDERGRFNLYQLQRQAYSTAKLSGDCLVIRRIDPLTFMPRIQLVDGKHIETPFEFSMGINPSTGRQVINGVEIEANGSETGYWVRTAAFKPGQNNVFNLGYQFVDAFGKNSGRRRANLVYGSRLRVDEYRGMPLLAHAMQMLKQIDRTLDNAQLAMALDAQVVLSIVTDVKAPQSASNMVGNGPLQKTAARTATVNLPQEDGRLAPAQVFYPEYYRSMVARLYNFDGQAVTPERSVVISYDEKMVQEGVLIKVISNVKEFPSYEAATAYISSQESDNYRLVGDNPFISPVPLAELKHYKLIYSSDGSVTQPGVGDIPSVKIFEYTK